MTHPEDAFRPHKISWSREKSSRFWDWISEKESYQTFNFGGLAGDEIIRIVKRAGVSLKGNSLDYGCGPGYFMEKMLAAGASCSGVDFSKSSVEAANERLSSRASFNGAELLTDYPLPFEATSFDLVFMLETLEHLLTDEIEKALGEARRVMTDNGHVVVTTPNDENLERGEIICPDCGCVFHSGQHVQSWTPKTLSDLMERSCFRTILCRAVNIRPPSMLNPIRKLIAKKSGLRPLNLIYIGRKSLF